MIYKKKLIDNLYLLKLFLDKYFEFIYLNVILEF